ncbi:MAG TPA: hydratase [Thermoanaerobacterales bacterium]|nr:hydratase [Thermoanaerobacterales bacterium]
MVKLYDKGVYLVNGKSIIPDGPDAQAAIKQLIGFCSEREEAKKGTIAYKIMEDHNCSDNTEILSLKFDSITSHDLTYVGIIQSAKASGMEKFPLPYVLTNCHNSLCAVGGTINEDDHMYAFTAAQKYGGIYVPPHIAVIHQYMREMMSGCGKMILGSDSHTRYGALGTMGIGEGGGELVKQLLGKTYDIPRPEVVAVYLKNKPHEGVGPHDVALALIGAVFGSGYVKNKVLEFIGDGVSELDVEYRNGIDVMTTETGCLSSIWETDEKVKNYLEVHGRLQDYKKLSPASIAYYDGLVEIDLAAIRPMIALPFHPSNAYTIDEFNANAKDILYEVERYAKRLYDGRKLDINIMSKLKEDGVYADQGIIAGCAGGNYNNICDAASVMNRKSPGNGRFTMSIYPSSQPIYFELVKNGIVGKLMSSGVVFRSAFCGPCFGAGDVPANGGLSIRHTTRNFPNREGSKPAEGQIAWVALMDARSIAATAVNRGRITPATEFDVNYTSTEYSFNKEIYINRVFNGFNKEKSDIELQYGPNITDWPEMPALTDNILIRIASFITDPVTTTDELIPSGDTGSYRSNPIRLSEFTLSRKDPEYVQRAKKILAIEKSRRDGEDIFAMFPELECVYSRIKEVLGEIPDPREVSIGTAIYAIKPGDGSAREQAASCQKVLGGWANIAVEYATQRYRTNLINWGIIPFMYKEKPVFQINDFIYIPGIKNAIINGSNMIKAFVINSDVKPISLYLQEMTPDERKILVAGCLINFYRG